jgi:hypothetical protein
MMDRKTKIKQQNRPEKSAKTEHKEKELIFRKSNERI